ncbi:hypothetical protein H072_2676 [Dactylellina haptotyla CBS 200.50]|uniref:Bet v I/Major latex protein domain-containing protein n=1 Tax=Dactylellina haptotyla (strain CBS 200.50) TaxID=1284197 RepID=S8AKA3_DACHA|nr:hypothetical protein H072_2676 [Dactylellina haptotyla CBS 200.50]
MAAKTAPTETTPAAEIITPGLSTPHYPDGGFFTVKAAPITINATKDQVLDVLLRVGSYHAWSSFLCEGTNIVHPKTRPQGGSNMDGDDDADIVTVGSTFDVKVRLFPAVPAILASQTEKITSIEKSEEAYIITWSPTDITGERVHIISEPDHGYGTCKYETYETFQMSPKAWMTKLCLSSNLVNGFGAWSADLKKAVEGRNLVSNPT